MRLGLVIVLVLAVGVGRAAAQPDSPASMQSSAPATPGDASAPGAAAGDASELARVADRTARAHYDAHDYAAAISEYRKAYSALPDALFLFDIAQAYRQLHDCDHALEYYRDYLHARPVADNRGKVEQFITEMTSCATQPTLEVLPAPSTAASSVTAPEPPTAVVDDHVTAPAGQSTGTLRFAGVVTAGVGALVLGAAVYYAVQAGSDAGQIETMCAKGCSGSAISPIDQAGQAANRDAIAGYAIGGAALAAGAGMFLWATLRAHGAPPVVMPSPAPGGATVSARVRF